MQKLVSGCGTICSTKFEFEGGAAQAERFVDALKLIIPSTSLGGIEYFADRRRLHPTEPEKVPESLVRLRIEIQGV